MDDLRTEDTSDPRVTPACSTGDHGTCEYAGECTCPCHGYYVTVWVKGPASKDDADALVERLLVATAPGVPVGTEITVVGD